MRILLAIDDSKFSEAATQTLVRQFRSQGNEVLVLRVMEPIELPEVGPTFMPNMNDLLRDRVNQAEQLVARAAQTLRAAGFKVRTAVDEGDVRTRIVETAEDWRADLIILGSHGRKGLDRFLMGSVSEAVARFAHCSVEIVRIPTAEKHPQA